MTNSNCKCVFYLDGRLDRSKCPAHFDADLFLSIMPIVDIEKLDYEKDKDNGKENKLHSGVKSADCT